MSIIECCALTPGLRKSLDQCTSAKTVNSISISTATNLIKADYRTSSWVVESAGEIRLTLMVGLARSEVHGAHPASDSEVLSVKITEQEVCTTTCTPRLNIECSNNITSKC